MLSWRSVFGPCFGVRGEWLQDPSGYDRAEVFGHLLTSDNYDDDENKADGSQRL